MIKAEVKAGIEEGNNALFNRLLPILSQFVTRDEFHKLDKKVNILAKDVSQLKDDIAKLTKKVEMELMFHSNDIKLIKGKLHMI